MTKASELSGLLARRMPALVRELLPRGRAAGREWRVGGVTGERGQSLAIALCGPKAGVWSDFATGERGDALGLVAAVLFGGNVREAMAWARTWLGRERPPAPALAPFPPAVPRAPQSDEEIQRQAAAIWHSAEASLSDTPTSSYLRARGIELAELPRPPGAIRNRRCLWCAEARKHLPAMVAAVSGPCGKITAVHRTWLAVDGAGVWRKAPLAAPKKALGSVAGGSVRIARGGTGMPLAKALPGETVVLAEGIETALSIAVACPELRVLAALSLANLGRVSLPAGLQVILAADSDGDNPAAMAGLRRAVEMLRLRGYPVRIARSDVGSDFNDLLHGEAA